MAKFTFGTLLLLAGCSMEPQDTVRQPPKLEEYFQRPVEIIYNEGGQGGDIGARMAASADPGQLTLFVGTVGNVTLLPNILSSYNIDPLRS